MKMKKVLLATACAAALVVGSVAGTMAYLTSQDEVVNTFTVGDVAITLDEADVDGDSNTADNVTVNDEARDKANAYKLIPGTTYDKDPIVRVDATSEDCWLFVEVENEISAIEGGTTVAAQMAANGWTPVAGTKNVYSYSTSVSKNANIPVFDTFTIADSVSNEILETYQGKTITVTAYAVQEENFENATAAWNAAFGGSESE